MNLLSQNPLNFDRVAGVSAVPMAARVARGRPEERSLHYLLMHAMGPMRRYRDCHRRRYFIT